jgi:hypothetical protein
MTDNQKYLNYLEMKRNMLKMEINSSSGNSIFHYIEEIYLIKKRSHRIEIMWSILQEN